MLGLNSNEELKCDEQDSVIVNSTSTSPKTIIKTFTTSNVHSLPENNRKRSDLSTAFNDQDNEFDNNNLNNSDAITFNRNSNSHNELSHKKTLTTK